MRRLTILLGAAMALTAQARADDRFCSGVGFADTPALVVGRIKPETAKVHFVRNGGAKNVCPSTAPACQDKAFLVPGDLVVLGVKRGDFICVDYDNGKGDRGGWLPALAIEPAPLVADPAGWAGKWSRVEAEIRIDETDGGLQAQGSATFGALDPARVKRGAVNSGEFSGALALKDGQAGFTDKEADPKNPDASCRLRFARAGDALFVRDNMQCGGMNVSFSGFYQRAK